MIRMLLKGGLGNQLFQYATAKAIAGENIPILDTYLLSNDHKRSFALDVFQMNYKIIDSSALHQRGRIRRFISKHILSNKTIESNLLNVAIYKENNTHGCFDQNVVTIKKPVVLDGYFQSERYFAHIASKLRKEIITKREFTPIQLMIEDLISSARESSVSIHVRRGDYANEHKTLAFHGLIDYDYYKSSIDKIFEHVVSPQFFLFTDDPLVGPKLIPPNIPITVVSGRGLSDICELQLMSQCKHHIIANSSYSWWGAWLGSPDGITLAPRRWFAQPSESSIRDRFPSSWYVL